MLKKIFNNWPIKLLAAVLACIAWFVIMSMADPTSSKTVYNVPITLLHEDILTAAGKSYTVESNLLTNVRVSAPNSVLRTLTPSDFTATADVSKMFDVTGLVPVEVSWSNSSLTASQVTALTESIRITIENIRTSRFQIDAELVGTAEEGYFAGNYTVSPRTVTVTGRESIVNQISTVKTEVDITGLSESTLLEGPLYFYDSEGSLLPVEQYEDMSFSVETASVSVDILTMKTIPLVINVENTDQVAEGYRYTGSQQSLASVQIKGLKSRLAQVNSLTVPASELDLVGATGNLTYEFDIRQFLPDGIALMDDQESTLTVVLMVEEEAVHSFEVPLTVNGRSQNYTYEIAEQAVTVELRALEEDFLGFDEGDLTATLELTGLDVGRYTLTVTVECSDSIFTIVNHPAVTVTIRENNQSSSPQTNGFGDDDD